MKRPDLTLAISPETTIQDRLETLHVLFRRNRHRYAFRRCAAIEELFASAATDIHVKALGETLNSWLPSVELFENPTAVYPRAMAA